MAETFAHGETLTAIVVSHDSAGVLGACLASLAAEGVPAIVVDNASLDASREVAEEAGARVIASPRNEGFGRAMNIGVQEAATPFVLLVNPDLTFEPGAVAALLAAARLYPDAGLLAPRLIEPDGRHFFAMRSSLSPFLHNVRGRKWTIEGDCCAPFLSGACLLAPRDLFLALGGFDADIFLFYEDDDLCARVAARGRALVHVDGAVARHLRGRSSSPRPGRTFKVRYHMAWSRLYVARKWGRRESPWPWIARSAVKLALAALVRNRKRMERHAGTLAGARDFLRGKRAIAREGLE
ncbi:glycosyltransferase family 2 protein [Salinarimonas sp.]|uniref:glycosyltransferase family 2 protein n=1 Tax=Salinarimonas sp. TaxID=2766526 RepID=UPI0032D95265